MGQKKSDDDNKKNNQSLSYPNAALMLDIIRSEYDVENERKKTLDSKAATFITVNVALLTIFIPLIPFTSIIDFWNNDISGMKTLAIFGFIGLGISVVLLIVAFVLLVRVAAISGYARVDLDSILECSAQNIERSEISYVQQGLVAHYYTILRGTIDEKGNCKINSDRADGIQYGITITVIGYVFLFISTILLRIVV